MQVFIRRFTVSLVTAIALVMAFNYVMDPLAFYRLPKLYQAQYSTNARYQLPGLIKNVPYDTLVIGTSMSRNFVESDMNEVWNVQSFNASIPSATAREMRLAFELAARSHPDLRNVMWELNFYSFAREPDDVEDDQGEFPYYLWDDVIWNDYRYLFSLYPLQRTREILTANFRRDGRNRDIEKLYKFGWNERTLTAEEVKQLIDVPSPVARSMYKYDIMLANFRENVLPAVRNHPDVQFRFYYPPYGVFWHVRAHKQNPDYLESVTRLKSTIYEELSQYENVRIYDFQDRADITHDIARYIDVAHYVPEINRWMIGALHTERPLSSVEEAAEKAETLKEQVLTYRID